jgi:hypothetical protein
VHIGRQRIRHENYFQKTLSVPRLILLPDEWYEWML